MSADKFAHVIVGDFVALPRVHGPSDRYKVTRVMRRQFVGQHTRLETFRRFRKLDGRSVGTPHDMRFAEPTYCETLACRRRLGGLCDACAKRLSLGSSGT